MNRATVQIIILTLILSIIPFYASAQWQQAFSYKGDWSPWEKTYGSISTYTDDSGILLKTPGGQVYFRFYITNYIPPTKDQIKEHLKNKRWFEYNGVVQYMVNDKYPTAEAIAKRSNFVIPDPRVDETPSVLRTTTCKIRIEPYKKLPSNYNVYFDNIGVAISLKGMTFTGQKKHVNKGRVFANIIQSIFLFPYGIGSWWWNPVKEYDER